MRERTVDVAIIGAGSAGLAARREAELQGADYVLIERGPHGTTCARVGCMPSKLLIAAADAAHQVADAHTFGVQVEGVRIDRRQVMERVRRERDRFVGFVMGAVDALAPERKLGGHARFVGPNELIVDDHTRVIAKTTIIATGSSPWIPPVLEPVRDRVLVNDDIFELPDLPESMAVLGTGVIGLELGQALARLGVRVKLLNPFDTIGGLSDPALHTEAVRIFGAKLDLHLAVQDMAVEPMADGGVLLHWRDGEGEHRERFAHALAATGRRPNLAGLDLAEAGVALDERGAPKFDPRTMQIEGAPIFIAGDVDGELPILHEAADEGRIAAINASRYPEVRAHVRRTPLAVLFSDPQIAVVGKRHSELSMDDIVIGEIDYGDQGRARVMNRAEGLVHIYAEKERGVIVGAEMIGPGVEHTAHLLAWAVDQSLTVERALRMPFYHPVLEEGIRTALRNAALQLNLIPRPCAHELDCGPGA